MSSPLEKRFLQLWQLQDGPELEQEYRFHPTRRWKADFAHIPSRTIFEIEGGVWCRGRHTSPKGFMADAEKYLTATLEGWTVIRLTSPQLTPDIVKKLIKHVRS